MTDSRSPTLVLGLGNPILGDDGVGWRICSALEDRLAARGPVTALVGKLEIDRVAVGGLGLMERLVGYKRAVLVDAIEDGRPAGAIFVGNLEEAGTRAAAHLDSSHDTTLVRALELGDELGARLPDEISVVAVSVASVGDFGDELEPGVAAAVERAVDKIVDLLAQPLAVH